MLYHLRYNSCNYHLSLSSSWTHSLRTSFRSRSKRPWE